MDLLTLLTNYLATHKRLVVPQLGAFLVKEPGKIVVFSELMKRDDGVLRELLCAEGLSELEAHGRIDRFVFEVRNAVEQGEAYPLAGFGALRPGPNGTIVFHYDPATGVTAAAATASATTAVPAEPTEPVKPTESTEPTEPAAPAQPNPTPAPQPPIPPKPVSKPEPTATPEPERAPKPQPQPQQPAAVPQPEPVRPVQPGTPERLPGQAPSHINTDRMQEAIRTAFQADRASQPTAADEARPKRSSQRPAAAPAPAPHRKPAYTLEESSEDPQPVRKRKKRVDRFLLIAIAAALLAVAAIAFGFWREAHDSQEAHEAMESDLREQIEQFSNPLD